MLIKLLGEREREQKMDSITDDSQEFDSSILEDAGLEHPLGCRHSQGKKKILGCAETYLTKMVGGLQKIEDMVVQIEQDADKLDVCEKVGEHGMHLGQHSMVMACEVCGKHSMVSYENYLSVLEVSGVDKVEQKFNFAFSNAAEYYMYAAKTYPLLKTPDFSRLLPA